MIEHEAHSHGHRTGLPWLDLILAGSAIFISVVSLIISIQHGRTMEKLVEANEKQVKASTLPILRFNTGNVSENQSAIHFDLRNGGTGPAMIQWFRIKWNGQPTASPKDLLDRCCRAKPQADIYLLYNTASGMTLPAGQSQMVFYLRAAGADPDAYRQLDKEARFKIEAESCYCSVLDECWTTDFKGRPRNVKACEMIFPNQWW